MAVVVLAACALLQACQGDSAPNGLRVLNLSGQAITSIHVLIRETASSNVSECRIERLEPGADFTLHHAFNDSSLELTFELQGQRTTHAEPYVDLWTGETWTIRVLKEGKTDSNYDSNFGRPTSGSK